jgi:hypothetical protein
MRFTTSYYVFILQNVYGEGFVNSLQQLKAGLIWLRI